jgi:hypothetical protein
MYYAAACFMLLHASFSRIVYAAATCFMLLRDLCRRVLHVSAYLMLPQHAL